MPYYQFTLQIDAVKHVPLSDGASDSVFQVRWFLNEDTRGGSAPLPRVGDEVSFNYSTRFGVDSKGLITQLLQVSLVDVTAGESSPSPIGVLMIDLNAHVPRAPKTASRQKATLAMSRCVCDPPVLIRLGLECVPARAPSVEVPPPSAGLTNASLQHNASSSRLLSAQMSRQMSVPGASPVPRAPSGGRSVSNPGPDLASLARGDDEGTEATTTADTIDKLRSSVSALTAANDQLRDENVLLRRALDRARTEGDFTFSTNRSNVDYSVASLQQYSREQDEQEKELATLRAEQAIVKKNLATATEALKRSEGTEADLRREVHTLTRSKAFLQAELDRTMKDLDHEREESRRRADGPAELMSLREMLGSSQQMVKDLRAMLHSSDTLAESLKKELSLVKKEYEDKLRRATDACKAAEQRAAETEQSSEKAVAAVALGQRELVKMHRYGVDVANRLKATSDALTSERSLARQLQRQLEDLKAVSSAHSKFAASIAAKDASQRNVAAAVMDLSGAIMMPRGRSVPASNRTGLSLHNTPTPGYAATYDTSLNASL